MKQSGSEVEVDCKSETIVGRNSIGGLLMVSQLKGSFEIILLDDPTSTQRFHSMLLLLWFHSAFNSTSRMQDRRERERRQKSMRGGGEELLQQVRE